MTFVILINRVAQTWRKTPTNQSFTKLSMIKRSGVFSLTSQFFFFFFFWSRCLRTDLEFILVFIIVFNDETLAFSWPVFTHYAAAASAWIIGAHTFQHVSRLHLVSFSILSRLVANNQFSISFDRWANWVSSAASYDRFIRDNSMLLRCKCFEGLRPT